MTTRPVRLRFATSATRLAQLPDTRAEVAFVGRSNVGKSSLINALAGTRQLARVSNTPGRTQLINVFFLEEDPQAALIDLPGYGYAKVPARVRAGWQPMIEGYLLGRDTLVQVFVLVDAEIGPTPLDVQMLDWLRANDLPHTVVGTKTDKVKPSRRPGRKAELAAACDLEPGDIVWVSTTNGAGVDQLRDLLRAHLAP